ncbi:hypothetical protein [Caminibacter sp.]
MRLAKWIIAGAVSYIATIPIKNFVWNLIISTAVFYLSLHFINKFLEGEI